MEKKYDLPEENPKKNLEEPAISYRRNPVLAPPCVFTDDEKYQQIEQGIKDMEKGLGYTLEEVFDKYRK